MGCGTRRAERLAHEQPARARLDRDVDLLVREASDPTADTLRRGSDAATMELARLPVESVEGDLRSVHVEPGYDRHRGPPLKLRQLPIRASLSRRAGEAPVHAILARPETRPHPLQG
jgi:hypothetical protein